MKTITTSEQAAMTIPLEGRSDRTVGYTLRFEVSVGRFRPIRSTEGLGVTAQVARA